MAAVEVLHYGSGPVRVEVNRNDRTQPVRMQVGPDVSADMTPVEAELLATSLIAVAHEARQEVKA